MSWAPTEFQKSLYDVLTADSALQTLLGGAGKILDHVPDNLAFPYVTIGEVTWASRNCEGLRGWSGPYTINVWYRDGSDRVSGAPSSGRGRKNVQAIQKRIDELLDNVDICIDDWNVIAHRAATVDILVDPDGVTLHGIQIFNLLISEV